jgi:hypothetical protein
MVDWEKNWRGNGLIAAVLFLVSYIILGRQATVGASPEKLVAFYDGDRTRILIASVVFGFAILCLMWFAAALASALSDAGKEGWGRAATTASAAIGAVYLVLITLWSALAHTIAGSANDQVTAALNDLTWVLHNFAWFPIAMLIMAGSFGLWRAGIFSNAAFGAGVMAMVLVLLGTTTWASDGFWAADGAYVRIVPTLAMLIWLAAVSVFLMRRSPSTVSATPPRAASAA